MPGSCLAAVGPLLVAAVVALVVEVFVSVAAVSAVEKQGVLLVLVAGFAR